MIFLCPHGIVWRRRSDLQLVCSWRFLYTECIRTTFGLKPGLVEIFVRPFTTCARSSYTRRIPARSVAQLLFVSLQRGVVTVYHGHNSARLLKHAYNVFLTWSGSIIKRDARPTPVQQHNGTLHRRRCRHRFHCTQVYDSFTDAAGCPSTAPDSARLAVLLLARFRETIGFVNTWHVLHVCKSMAAYVLISSL